MNSRCLKGSSIFDDATYSSRDHSVRKLVVTCIAIVGFVLLYEVSMFDSRESNPA